ncbi:A disintegrin and metalloproteinase with thrombospondin motifs 5-like, partial [Coregonus clupeaformis]|uniref:A disintegrin and metalloproteinase with thrombospondin motifs 5-like n=1 Tax=Coregonus clupeaformis TaxID=59861 RepID=UPI001E1C32F3
MAGSKGPSESYFTGVVPRERGAQQSAQQKMVNAVLQTCLSTLTGKSAQEVGFVRQAHGAPAGRKQVHEKEKGLEVSKNAAATLKSFCKWQNQQNPLDDDNQRNQAGHAPILINGAAVETVKNVKFLSPLWWGSRGLFRVETRALHNHTLIRTKGHDNDERSLQDKAAESALHYFTRESFSFEAMPVSESCGTKGGRGRMDASRKHQRKGRGKGKRDRHDVTLDGGKERRRWWTQFSKRASPPSLGSRRKRSVSRARHVELLLVADESMSKKYGKDLHHYLLTLASIASKLYSHASIENPIRLSVVKVAIVTEKEKGLEVSKNAAATLKSFCKWQNQQNPLDDDNQHHHDAAILFTRQ